MQRHLSAWHAAEWSLVALGGGLGLLWALLCIPIGLAWGVSPWSPVWQQIASAIICFPLFVGFYGGAALDRIGLVIDPLPLIILSGIAIGALCSGLFAYRFRR